MKHIIREYDLSIETTPILHSYLDSDSFAVLDIETSGLSPVYSSVILVGMLMVTPDIVTLHQLFATTPNEEPELLMETINLLSNIDYLVTYNGRMFDIPFLNKRAEIHNMDFPKSFNLDLFLLLRYYSPLPTLLQKMSQKSLEEYANISHLRQDRISGGESVDLYSRYLETLDSNLEEKILLHNSDDVLQLYRLMPLIRNADIHKAFYKTGFPIDGGRITKIDIKSGDLIIKGLADNPIDYISFPSVESPYHLQISRSKGEFEIVLPCEAKANGVFVDLKDLFSEESKATLANYPSYVNDYLILKEAGEFKYLEINMLAKLIAEEALLKI